MVIGPKFRRADFGGHNDKNPKWLAQDVDVTSILRNYRQRSVEGAQMRKELSDARILSLSNIFLISNNRKCFLTTLDPEKRRATIKTLDTKKELRLLDDNVIITCRNVHRVLTDDEENDDDMNDRLEQIKLSSTNKDSKALVTIASSFIGRYNTRESSHQDGEAKLIIEGLRPFIMNCIISSIKSATFDWLTYHLLPHPTHPNNQTMIPDFTLFMDPLSTMNFELFFVEVKRPGNTSNGTLESDLTKLGKEMQIALNKLVLQKVDKPVVVGLLIEGTKASTFKMDIVYNGQYRMVELS
ncbi:unnamed protein product [Mucor hiemalis]